MRRKKLYILNVGDFTIALSAYEAPGVMIEKIMYPTYPASPTDISPQLVKLVDLDPEGVRAIATIAPYGKLELTFWEKLWRAIIGQSLMEKAKEDAEAARF